jgi:hypothetical protein
MRSSRTHTGTAARTRQRLAFTLGLFDDSISGHLVRPAALGAEILEAKNFSHLKLRQPLGWHEVPVRPNPRALLQDGMGGVPQIPCDDPTMFAGRDISLCVASPT